MPDPPPAPQNITADSVLVVVRAPHEIMHRHFAILRVITSAQVVKAPFDIGDMMHAAIETTIRASAPTISVQRAPAAAAEIAAFLDADCAKRRARPMSAACRQLLDAMMDEHDVDAVVLAQDWAEHGLLGPLHSQDPGTGVLTRRSEANTVNAIAYSHLGTHVFVRGQPVATVAPPCHEDGSGVHHLPSSFDPDLREPVQFDWLADDLRRRITANAQRSLARSGVVAGFPASCADPESEGTGFKWPMGF